MPKTDELDPTKERAHRNRYVVNQKHVHGRSAVGYLSDPIR
jgi:hypothetical protein